MRSKPCLASSSAADTRSEPSLPPAGAVSVAMAALGIVPWHMDVPRHPLEYPIPANFRIGDGHVASLQLRLNYLFGEWSSTVNAILLTKARLRFEYNEVFNDDLQNYMEQFKSERRPGILIIQELLRLGVQPLPIPPALDADMAVKLDMPPLAAMVPAVVAAVPADPAAAVPADPAAAVPADPAAAVPADPAAAAVPADPAAAVPADPAAAVPLDPAAA